jgi:hypothetical protein
VRETLGEEHFPLPHSGLGRPDRACKQGPDAAWRHSSREGGELLLHLLQGELCYIEKHVPEKQQHALLILVVVARFEVEQEKLRRAAAASEEGGRGTRGAKAPAESAGRGWRWCTSPQRRKEERMRKARAS